VKKLTVVLLVLFMAASLFAGSGSDKGSAEIPQQSNAPLQQVQQQTAQPQAPASPYFTGDGGRGKSITILPPRGSGIAKDQAYLPDFVANELVSNFRNFSAMTLFDRVNNQKQYDELLSGYYDDNDKAGQDLGHLASTEYMLLGDITKTSTGYTLHLMVNKNSDKTNVAAYSGTVSIAELDNLMGIRRASLNLLQKMGVTLTAKAQEELTRAAATNQVTAQTALAKGISAQRQGTEVAALSYYFQAAAYDTSLLEAANRSSILAANITSGNIGDNIRNDIQWRKDWIARLTETEQFLDSFNRTESMPYILFYTSDIKQIGETNYKNETVTMGGIETHLHGSSIWTISIERALQAVYDGLDATKRKDVWGLGGWPRQGVTNLNFVGQSQNFTVVFELLNDQNKVIGRQTVQTGGSWGLNWSGRPVVNVNANDRKTVNFQNVNANDISDRMTIRVASVNGANAETAARNGVLQIRASNKGEFDTNDKFRFSKGEIQGLNTRDKGVVIPDNIWGDPVISISKEAFKNAGLTSVTFPNSITIIEEGAFANNSLFSVTIPDSVKTIGASAFANNPLNQLIIGNNVTLMGSNSFGGSTFQGFPDCYNQNGRKAGTYTASIFRFAFAKGEIQGFVDDADITWNLVIPDTIWGIPVTSIGNEAFKNNSLTSVTIPNSVTRIGRGAFYKNSGGARGKDDERTWIISSITIGANVNMARDAFNHSGNVSIKGKGGSWTLTSGWDRDFDRDNGLFYNYYDQNGRKAGTYTCYATFSSKGFSWEYSPK